MRALVLGVLITLLIPVRTWAEPEGTKAVSSTNPWLGAQVGLKIAGKGEFPDRLGGSAQVRLQSWSARSLEIPLYGNVSKLTTPEALKENSKILENLVQSSEGVHLRLVPNYEIGSWKNSQSANTNGDHKEKKKVVPGEGRLNLWASIGWHLTAVRDSIEGTREINEGRFGLGAEVRIPSSMPGTPRPTTLSVEGVNHTANRSVMRNAIGRDLPSFQSLELTGIVPISKSEVGILVEGILSNRHVPSVWRIGLVFAAAQTSK